MWVAKPPGREVFPIHLGRRNRGLPSGSPAAAGWLRTAEATPDIRIPLQTRSGEFEPAQRIKLLRDGARIIGRGASCPREDPTCVFEVLREDLDRCRRVPVRVHHRPIHFVADVCEPQRRFDGSTMVAPQSAHGLEPVVIEELPALACDQPNSFVARLRRSPSRSSIALTPTAAFSWKTNPALIDSMIAGVPPSSR